MKSDDGKDEGKKKRKKKKGRGESEREKENQEKNTAEEKDVASASPIGYNSLDINQ